MNKKKSEKTDPYAWNNAIQKMNEHSKSKPHIVNRWDYLRGKNGIVVHVFPNSFNKFSVQVKGKMGWSEGLFGSVGEAEWGRSGTYTLFNSFDEALEEGIARVDYLIETIIKPKTEEDEQ